ncbi:MAG: valine--tRNA ligase [Alphaproteobacteria bacterium]|nr:valine--tRNA ligase [Alphaproteobacteria bacterium]
MSVHPEDERYKALIGKHVILPLIGRRLPVVADSYSDPEKGTGAVKITPAHDFNDFELGKRHNLERINVFDQFACLFLEGNAAFLKACHPPEETMALHGLGRFDARIRVVEMMERKGFLEKVDEHTHMVPFGTRSDELIEPWLTDQWYLDASALAVPAIESVKAGRTVFVPKSWEKTYFDWMQNIQPWCISRQLWWGHQIPAWYGPKHPRAVDSGFPSRQGEIFVAGTEDEALTLARDFYPPEYEVTIAGNDRETDMSRSAECEITAAPSIVLFRDEDVLDTWFSSGLWPFSTLGWPNDTSEFQRFYPTDLLVTGFDIIFFWVARMMMLGIYFTKKEPFKTVYIHALVRDESGQKMSKSKGNVIDPLELIELHGADVLRFTLSIMAAQGRDIKLSRGRLEGYRNFITKLWNSVRFAQMNECFLRKDFDPGHCKTLPGRWIAGEVERAVISVTSDIERHRYNEAAEFLYRFVWNRFCDWYLELAKPVLNGPDEAEKIEIQSMTAWVLDQILLLLHPFIPFVTEELWLETGDAVRGRDNLLILSSWPHFSSLSDRDADEEMQWLIDLVSKIRSVRAEINVPAGSLIPLAFISASSRIRERVDLHATSLKQLGRIDCVDFFPHAPDNSVEFVSDDCVVALCLAGVVDLEAEKLRLEGEVEKITTRIEKMNINLSNAAFLSRAPEHVVEKQKAVCLEAELTRDKIYESLARVLSALK